MRINVKFGHSGLNREVVWWKDLKAFPHFVNYDGKTWEWVMYDVDLSNHCDYVVHFGQMSSWAASTLPATITVIDFAKEFNVREDFMKCECGAETVHGKQTRHSYWCPKWTEFK